MINQTLYLNNEIPNNHNFHQMNNVETIFKSSFGKWESTLRKMKTGVATNLFRCDWITFKTFCFKIISFGPRNKRTGSGVGYVRGRISTLVTPKNWYLIDYQNVFNVRNLKKN